MKKVLITGAGGFIGSHLTEYCVELGFQVKVFVRYNSNNSNGWLGRSKYLNEIEVVRGDIRDFDFMNCSLVTSIFTLQFMPKKDRSNVIDKIYDGLNTGGAFIFSEKTIAENATMQDMITFNYYDFKLKSFSSEDILTKEKTLRNMMKPNTVSEIEDMIQDAGFSALQQFWRNHNFVGFIAIK